MEKSDETKSYTRKAALKIVVGSIMAAYGLHIGPGIRRLLVAQRWQFLAMYWANMTRLTICGASFAVAVVMLVFVFSMTAAKSTSAQ